MARPTDRPTDAVKPDSAKAAKPVDPKDDKYRDLFLDPRREEALRKVRENLGKDTFVAAIDEFRATWGLPDPYDLLQIVFENHPATAVRVEALEKMDKLVDAQADSSKQVFKTRVKLLQLTAREPELKKLAVRIARARKY